MGITINNLNGGIEIVIDTENKKMFPKESTRVELKDNRVVVMDVDPEQGETVTMDVSGVDTPSLANNTLLYEAVRNMVYGNPKTAAIAASGADTEIVAAVSGKKIRVLSMFGIADVAGTVRFEDGESGDALTGQVPVGTNGGYVLPYNENGWFETAAGNALNLEMVTAVSFAGSIVYEEI